MAARYYLKDARIYSGVVFRQPRLPSRTTEFAADDIDYVAGRRIAFQACRLLAGLLIFFLQNALWRDACSLCHDMS